MSKIATTTKVVHDDALGIDRRVVAGDIVPPDLAAAYKAAGGGTDEAHASGGVNVAGETRIVHDDALGIDRRVVEGQPVPPDLLDAYRASGGSVTDAPAATETDDEEGYEAQSVDELKAEAERRGLEVEGSGADGRVLKADLVAALEEDDE